MPDKLTKPKLSWPRWAWRDSGWWLTAFGAVFAAVVFVQPAISHRTFWVRLAICFGWFVFSSLLLLVTQHLLKVLSVAIERLRAYNDLYDLAEQQSEQIEIAKNTILELSSELTNSRRFEIDKTLFYNNALYIVLKKNRNRRLEIGHRVRVIDAQDGGIMGVFEVNEVRTDGYRAKAEYADAVWLGFIRATGNAEASAPPNTVAFLMTGD